MTFTDERGKKEQNRVIQYQKPHNRTDALSCISIYASHCSSLSHYSSICSPTRIQKISNQGEIRLSLTFG